MTAMSGRPDAIEPGAPADPVPLTPDGGVEAQVDLADLARRGRLLVVESVAHSGAGHIGGPLSAMDLLLALFFRVLRIRPDEPDWPDRDRFILSKGHSAIGLYVAMALRGYFPVEELATFDTGDSRLQGHPDMTRLPGLEASTGLARPGPRGRPGDRPRGADARPGRPHVRHARRRRDPGRGWSGRA